MMHSRAPGTQSLGNPSMPRTRRMPGMSRKSRMPDILGTRAALGSPGREPDSLGTSGMPRNPGTRTLDKV